MPEPIATPMCRSVELQLTGQPDTRNKYGSGTIRPERVVYYYLDGRINAHLYGLWVRENGELTDAPVDQLHRWDDDWPHWMTALAGEHDPKRQADTSRIEAAARRALDSLANFILDTTDPGVEALGAQYELRQALIGQAPAIPTVREWYLESLRGNGVWTKYSAVMDRGDLAHQDYTGTVASYGENRAYRLVCATTTHVIEAEHQPDEED